MTAAIPLVTIGLPLYNTAGIMEASVEDLLGQTFTDFELVISDNASSDETGEICRALAERDPRVRYFRQETNVGIVENQNAVFRLARSKYFKWASANDRCDRALVAKCVEVLERHDDVILCFPRTQIIDSDDNVVRECADDLHLMDGAPSSRFVKLMNRIQLNNAFNGLFRADKLKFGLPMAPDLGSDLSMMAALTLYGKFYELPEYLFQRRIDQASHTAQRMRQKSAETDDYLYGSAGNGNVQNYGALKKFYRLVKAVRLAPVSWGEKRRICAFLALRFMQARHELAREIYLEFTGKRGRAA